MTWIILNLYFLTYFYSLNIFSNYPFQHLSILFHSFYRCIDLNSIKKPCFFIPLIYLALENPSLSFSSQQGGWVLQNISPGIIHFCLLLEFSNWEAPAGKPCVEAEWNHSTDLLFTPCHAMDLLRRFSSIATTLTGFWEHSARLFPSSCMLVQGNSFQHCQSLVFHHLLLDF